MNRELFASLGKAFTDAGHELFLVGGPVRDMVLGRPVKDWDFATSAVPDQTQAILAKWGDNIWDVGARFGTIAASRDGHDIEITTFRTDGPGRKPEVEFTDSIIEDLRRRDFTVNAMALRVDAEGLHERPTELIDPFGGMGHIVTSTLETPRDPEDSFGDDPLRMLRAARFVSQIGLTMAPRVEQAIKDLRIHLDDISAERVLAEMDKLLMGTKPEEGMRALRDTGMLHVIFPGTPVATDQKVIGDDLETRWASILRDADPHRMDGLLRDLRFPNDRRRAVVDLVAWTQRWQGTHWLDAPESEVRRLVAASGAHWEQLAELVEEDPNRPLRARVESLLLREGHPEPFLTAKQVMDTLELKPGPRVGEAMRWLWELRLDQGKLHESAVVHKLRRWKESA
ncbi:tRNA nucleotidyltransferase [Mycobacterium phage ScoobyDoobyDoo]|nr:tRNA nucleotidyltransferase [Mycobacterium phage ScoobyDoobyDoo]